MTPSVYIQQGLKELRDMPLPIPAKQENIADVIYTLLLSKKFRKYAVNAEYLEHIRSAIMFNVSHNEPLKLTLVFGGYKLWRLTESPEADWAEVFSLMYYTQWLAPIAAIYKPGVWFDFYSDDVILETMDNIPKKDTEAYLKSFRMLLEFIQPYLPKNIIFTLHRVADQYKTYDDFLTELTANTRLVEKALGGLPRLTDDQRRLVELNVHLKPDQDKDPNWREKVYLIHEGYTRVSKRRPYYRTTDKIFVITRPIPDSIAVGTTKTSVVKFWVGAGVLERMGDGYARHIYSPSRLASNTFERQDIHINGLRGKNFSSIRIE